MTNAQDEEHLRLLSLFHFIMGGISCFFGSFPLIHVAIGACITFFPPKNDPQLAFAGTFFMLIGGFLVLIGWGYGITLIVIGRNIKQRRRYTMCFVSACISCLWMPFGTVLGVFTIIVLNRPEVKAAFDRPVVAALDDFPAPPRFDNSL